jgi:hypothetical protein
LLGLLVGLGATPARADTSVGLPPARPRVWQESCVDRLREAQARLAATDPEVARGRVHLYAGSHEVRDPRQAGQVQWLLRDGEHYTFSAAVVLNAHNMSYWSPPSQWAPMHGDAEGRSLDDERYPILHRAVGRRWAMLDASSSLAPGARPEPAQARRFREIFRAALDDCL